MAARDGLAKLKDLNVNDEVTVTLPTWIWMGFMAAYSGCKDKDAFTSLVAVAVQEEIYDPEFLAAREVNEAIAQEQMAHMPAFPGFPGFVIGVQQPEEDDPDA